MSLTENTKKDDGLYSGFAGNKKDLCELCELRERKK